MIYNSLRIQIPGIIHILLFLSEMSFPNTSFLSKQNSDLKSDLSAKFSLLMEIVRKIPLSIIRAVSCAIQYFKHPVKHVPESTSCRQNSLS